MYRTNSFVIFFMLLWNVNELCVWCLVSCLLGHNIPACTLTQCMFFMFFVCVSTSVCEFMFFTKDLYNDCIPFGFQSSTDSNSTNENEQMNEEKQNRTQRFPVVSSSCVMPPQREGKSHGSFQTVDPLMQTFLLPPPSPSPFCCNIFRLGKRSLLFIIIVTSVSNINIIIILCFNWHCVVKFVPPGCCRYSEIT